MQYFQKVVYQISALKQSFLDATAFVLVLEQDTIFMQTFFLFPKKFLSHICHNMEQLPHKFALKQN